ncbi:MAG: hydrogenase nickel incorporation protein HypB [Hespellia sp.]|nr:hydrogenase nickel incorporation protein HypB [Hespellia sp.]
MEKVKIIQVRKSILENNGKDADKLRDELNQDKTFYINIMSSPGSGKTSTILNMIKHLSGKIRIGVLEADIDSDVDAQTVQNSGIRAIQIHTGGMCHLDAEMSRQGLRELGTKNLDLVILENVGNLVCPAEFDTGAHRNIVILSVPEGDDKPLKYHLIFKTCNTVLINKIDSMPIFDFNMDAVKKYIWERNPKSNIFPVSAATGEGMEAWCDWLLEEIRKEFQKEFQKNRPSGTSGKIREEA